MAAGEPRGAAEAERPERGSVAAALGPRVRAARRDASLSQSQLARALRTTQSAASLYEGGVRGIGWDGLLVRSSFVYSLSGLPKLMSPFTSTNNWLDPV